MDGHFASRIVSRESAIGSQPDSFARTLARSLSLSSTKARSPLSRWISWTRFRRGNMWQDYLGEICGRIIVDPARFCSIGCKLECAKQNKDDTRLSLDREEYKATHEYEYVHQTEAELYGSSVENVCDGLPALCDSQEITCEHPIAKPRPKGKLRVDDQYWGMQHLGLPLKKRPRSQKLLRRKAQGSRENMNLQTIPRLPWCSLQASVQDLRGSIWQTLSVIAASEIHSNKSLRVHRRKGIPRRSPKF